MLRAPNICLILGLWAALATSNSAWAQGGTTVQGGHSGGWYNTNQSGHGIFAEVIDAPSSPTGKRVVVAWYAYFNGEQIWLLAVGDVLQDSQGQTAFMTAYIYEGNDFPPRYNPNLNEEILWGEIRMYFSGCDDAMLEWDSEITGYGSGSLQLRRLTTISGTSCDPELGGMPQLDDHGNSWPAATSFPTRNEYNNFIDGRHEHRDDVDVFVFTLTSSQQVAVFTIGNSDTRGSLHRITGNQEVEIASDDESGVGHNFVIEAELQTGTYSIHVEPTLVGIYGGYRLFVQTNTD